MWTGDVAAADRAARLFPLKRARRVGPAYARILYGGNIGETRLLWQRTLVDDPNAADLLFNLARADLQAGDFSAYKQSLERLRRLTPHNIYTEVVAVPERIEP